MSQVAQGDTIPNRGCCEVVSGWTVKVEGRYETANSHDSLNGGVPISAILIYRGVFTEVFHY